MSDYKRADGSRQKGGSFGRALHWKETLGTARVTLSYVIRQIHAPGKSPHADHANIAALARAAMRNEIVIGK